MTGFRHLKLILKLILFAGLLAGSSGCGLLPEKIDETKSWSVTKLYSEAKDQLDSGNYKLAVEYLEKLQARYPFGRYAQQAQLDLIYAYYKDNEPDSAIAAADRFIKTNPRNPYVDYAYYMRGLINFSREETAVSRFFPNDPSKTDTSVVRQSYNDFAELVRKFPQSPYAEDSRQRMIYLHNSLATHEVNVADYYLRRGAYVGAINRAQNVLQNYAKTPAVADALAIMVKAYTKLGLQQLAADSLRVLKLNFPESPEIPELDELVKGAA
jgi:outer membrane protein assembly factor BamD